MFTPEERPNYFETIIKLIIVLAVSVLVFVSPFLLYVSYAETGIIMYLVALIMLSPSIAFTYKKLIYFKKSEIKNALTSSKTYVGIIAVVNVFVFFTIGLDTLVSTFWLVVLYAITNFPIYFFSKKKLGLTLTVFSVSIVSILLLINRFSITETKEEQYRYVLNRATSTIYLENGQYEEYFGIRVFWANSKVTDYNKIKYKIGKGILGYRVVESYDFDFKR